MSKVCVLCRATAAAEVEMVQRSHEILRCTRCNHRYIDPAILEVHVESTYGDDYFFGGKDGYADYLDGADLLIKRGRKYARLLKKYSTTGSLLDVGAAAGFLAKGFHEEGWDASGVEPNRSMVEHGRSELGLNMIHGDLESLATDQTYHVVSMIQVIAHLHNLNLALEKLTTVTEPGGYLLIETWNRDSLVAKLMGKKWHELSPPSVLHWFSRDSLCEAMERHGFEQVDSGITFKWITLHHAVSLVGHSFNWGFMQKIARKIPASLTVPYFGDDLFWVVFKKK